MNESKRKRRAVYGVGTYRARQIGDKVVVLAEGKTPALHYKVWLQASAEEILPPIFELWWLPPPGGEALIATPFHVHAAFESERELEQVRVRDAKGVHDVRVEQMGKPEAPAEGGEPSKALVYLNHANLFNLKYKGEPISFTQANIAGDPILTYGNRQFYGREISMLMTMVGELITVTLEAVPDGDSSHLSLLLPPTWVSGYESVAIEAMVIETVTRSTIAGPPPGQEVLYEHSAKVKGTARFIVS
jgi:hypothetical protein